MWFAEWVAKLVGNRDADRDLRDEIDFHIEMRAAGYVKEGMRQEDADALALRQFGNKEAVMREMRSLRSLSASAAVITGTAVLIAAMLWISRTSPVRFPTPAPPMRFVSRIPPPPPRPGPTWEEFVKKVNTFGDGSPRPSRRP